MSPFRRVHPALSVNSWQFWITVAFFALGALFILQTVDNNSRVHDNAKAIRQACRSANDGRAASRAAWNRVEAFIVAHQKTALAKAETMAFFDATLGPSGRRNKTGPLHDRPC